jgi:hypothetical protein
MNDVYEPVHEIVDYYDGPRSGYADYRGEPHWFCALGWVSPPEDEEVEWDLSGFNPRDDRFYLVPVTAPNGSRIFATGTFRPCQSGTEVPPGSLRPLEVLWQPYGCLFVAKDRRDG